MLCGVLVINDVIPLLLASGFGASGANDEWRSMVHTSSILRC